MQGKVGTGPAARRGGGSTTQSCPVLTPDPTTTLFQVPETLTLDRLERPGLLLRTPPPMLFFRASRCFAAHGWSTRRCRSLATQAAEQQQQHGGDADVYDVVIVGGGMVGAALGALLGAHQGLHGWGRHTMHGRWGALP